MKFEWERVDKDTCRAKVFGGWLVKCYETSHQYDHRQETFIEWGCTSSVTFIPDVNHEWEIDK
jgi:hypothetical protein